MDSPANQAALQIRVIETSDAGAVSFLVTQLGYRRSPQQVAEWITSIAHGNRQIVFVACLGSEVVGWVEVSIVHHLQSAPHALIGGLVVKDGARGQGIGQALCRRAEEWAWSQSVDTVRVTSRSTRLDAHRFYVRDGYRVVKTSLVFDKDKQQ